MKSRGERWFLTARVLYGAQSVRHAPEKALTFPRLLYILMMTGDVQRRKLFDNLSAAAGRQVAMRRRKDTDDDGVCDDALHLLCQDANFNVVALTDGAGVTVEKTVYEAYGNPTWYYDSDEQTTSSVGNPFLFQGRRYCTESGLYYFRNRDLSPALGRFVQQDPLQYEDTMNLHGAFADRPIHMSDPFGAKTRITLERSGPPGKDEGNEEDVKCRTLEDVGKQWTKTYSTKGWTEVRIPYYREVAPLLSSVSDAIEKHGGTYVPKLGDVIIWKDRILSLTSVYYAVKVWDVPYTQYQEVIWECMCVDDNPAPEWVLIGYNYWEELAPKSEWEYKGIEPKYGKGEHVYGTTMNVVMRVARRSQKAAQMRVEGVRTYTEVKGGVPPVMRVRDYGEAPYIKGLHEYEPDVYKGKYKNINW